MNVFASALSQPIMTLPPPGFSIKVGLLRPSWAEALTRAVYDGLFDGYVMRGELWVSRSDIQDHIGPGHCTHDETDTCFIPLTEYELRATS